MSDMTNAFLIEGGTKGVSLPKQHHTYRQIGLMDKISLHIPINTPEQRIIRDSVVKRLSKQFEAVILSNMELVKNVDGMPHIFLISRADIYVDGVTDEGMNFFKKLAEIMARLLGDSVVLEVTRKSSYVATAQAGD